MSQTFIENDWEPEKDLSVYAGPDRIVHFTDYLEAKNVGQQKLFHCNFPEFDKHLNGLAAGEVTVISGKTGEGKTLFAESWLHSIMAKLDIPGLFFSYEVSANALLEKWQSFPAFPLYLPLELEAANVDWLAERILEAKKKYGCELVVLDHLHFLIDMSSKLNMSFNIGAFMRRLKSEIALREQISVLLIAHQKNVSKDGDASLEDVRDSSFICQEADNVIVVQRHKNFTTQELNDIAFDDALKADELRRRNVITNESNNQNFSAGFETIQIAKARRTGTFRWKKLFQKVGPLFEEV